MQINRVHGIKARTILMGIATGRNTRDVLRTDVLKVLKDSGVNIVIVSPAAVDEYFKIEFEDKNVSVENLYEQTNKMEKLFVGLMNGLFINTNFSDTIKIKYEYFKNKNFNDSSLTALSYSVRGVSSNLFSYKNYRLRNFMRWLNVMLFRDDKYDRIFEKYKPALVFTTHNFSHYGLYDMPLLKKAIRAKVPTVSMLSSWDNITTKGEMPVHIDKLIVWNERMRQEAIEYHGYSSEDVFVSGAPQYDAYFTKKGIIQRDKFLNTIGADPSKKVITYTAGSSRSFPPEVEVVDLIANWISNGNIDYPSQLIIRLNPHAGADNRFDRYEGSSNVIIDRTWHPSKNLADKWDSPQADMNFYLNLLYHSDLLINVASTTTIEAACFNIPIINIGFDGHQEKSYFESVRRYYDYSHYRRIIETGGVKLAKSSADLSYYINSYLSDPKMDTEGRTKIVNDVCQFSDGRSGERIAGFLLDLLDRGQ